MRRLLILLLTLLLPCSALADKTILITFTGDVTLGCNERMRYRADSFDSVREAKGDAYFFEKVVDLFSEDDLTVVNLEGVLSDSQNGEVTTKTHRFRGATSMVNILTLGSVEACNLANNHSHDYGDYAYHTTQQTLSEANIGYFGVRDVYIFEKDGIRIAFFGFNTTDFYGERDWFREEITRLREKESVDAVVFSFHAGYEYNDHHMERQELYAHTAIDAGADLVIMHHPHVVQGMEIYNNRCIFYSLGNFCFGGNPLVYGGEESVCSLQALIVRAELTFSDEGVYKGQQMKLYPANISGSDPENDYQPRLVTGRAARLVFDRVRNDTDFTLPPFFMDCGYTLIPYMEAEQFSFENNRRSGS